MGVRAAGLCAAKVRTASAGRYGDGDGLYLTVRPNASAFWVFRYTRGKMREMGLGRARGSNAVTLSQARARAGELHRAVRIGADPLADRDAAEAEARSAAQRAVVSARTFREAVQAFMASKGSEWHNAKHSKQWPNTLKTYVYPHFGDIPVSAIDTSHVFAALSPIWTTKNETASRVRGRIEAILDAEKVRNTRTGENPARWKGHLALLLGKRRKVATVTHHPALPYADMADFFSALRLQAGVGARALEFTILTAARSGMTFSATWGEIDFKSATWNVPKEHMKGGIPFRVPLSQQALALLRSVEALRKSTDPDCPIFPGEANKHISNATMSAVLDRMGRSDITVHGFRSSCRDWIGDCTPYPKEVAEMVLAHVISDEVEAAYRRGEMLRKRRKIMAGWGHYCEGTRRHRRAGSE